MGHFLTTSYFSGYPTITLNSVPDETRECETARRIMCIVRRGLTGECAYSRSGSWSNFKIRPLPLLIRVTLISAQFCANQHNSPTLLRWPRLIIMWCSSGRRRISASPGAYCFTIMGRSMRSGGHSTCALDMRSTQNDEIVVIVLIFMPPLR